METGKGAKILPNFDRNLKDREVRPEQISADILSELLKLARQRCGEDVQNCVITVPANFNDNQKKATMDACRIAGGQDFKVMRMISEPTAAALSYVLHRQDDEKTVIVFDFGGGTFDVTVLIAQDGILGVENTDGDNFLGGKDID